MKSALILYPHQLYAVETFPEVQGIFLVEDPLYFGVDQQHPSNLHKQKLILHRASMRRYVEEVLWPAGYDVEYLELDVLMTSADILDRAHKYDQLYVFDPVDEVLAKRLLQARRENPNAPPLEFLSNPNFYLKGSDAHQFFGENHKALFAEFYQWQRERFDILIGEDYKPLGGRWTFETTKQQRLPEGTPLPSFQAFGSNKFVDEAVDYVEKRFADNPGSTDFIWPTNHTEAAAWLQDFVETRLEHYSQYQDAVDSQAPWLYHSALAASLNIGLLSPQQVVTAALHQHAKQPVPIESLESFIRQTLGWREFIRGLYLSQAMTMRSRNVFKNQRKLTLDWYHGTLGLPPFDNLIRKVQQHAYVHHAERAIIAANLMVLAEIRPDEIQRWFSELFIDAYDWDTVPTLYALTQFVDSGNPIPMASITPSNYLLEISNYERGDWADVWDGLFWRFVETHRSLLSHHSQTRVIVQRLDRLDADRKRIIGYRAEDFLKQFTR
jgi:deoxyribodipyrimidine photolyase-related protein